MKEIVVLSGKGGTGKTTLTASFAYLAENSVFVDTDVDAANLHILLEPDLKETTIFKSGYKAAINPEQCISCGLCYQSCRFDAIYPDFSVNEVLCEGCGVCYHVCPAGAVTLEESTCGEWYVSNTRFGKFVHGKLYAGAENSGKLVSILKNKAKELAKNSNKNLLIVDGTPGIGCPVISAISGADLALIVTEPTLSGMHDMKRVIKVAQHFGITCAVCVNKADINLKNTEAIKSFCDENNIAFLGTIPFDRTIIKSLIAKKIAVETPDSPSSIAIINIWHSILKLLDSTFID